MAEVGEVLNNNELGTNAFKELVSVLDGRENKRYNSIGWQGTVSDLETQVNDGNLSPASSFAVVAEGIFRYKRKDPTLREDTDSLRALSKVLLDGSKIYGEADKVDGPALKGQIKKYVESHGGVFDESINWQEFIKTRSDKLSSRADAFDEANK